ncbi:Hsp70 family protein, partial [Escherichia coli]|uniref:Hsp70 family protein n=1 Tax=Escherichia coli TaxID=562 RepID=UPI000BE9AD5C
MDNAELAIGIDLGTTNSLIAVWKDGAAQLIPNKFGEYLTPSIISMGNDSNLLIVFYVQIMPDDFVMQLHR